MEFKASEKEKTMLVTMRKHLAELHQAWRDDPDCDGHCKSNEGYIGVLFRLDNWHECDSKQEYADKEPVLSYIEIYSYLFGPHRLHSFDTIGEAYNEVMTWTYE